MRVIEKRDLITADDLNAELCTITGADHTYAAHHYTWMGSPRTSWRCTSCHVVACGDYDEVDGCIEPYHHRGNHRTASGAQWPLGGDRA